MSYNQYGRGHQYGGPPSYGGYPGSNGPPAMGAPPGLAGPPPGMSAPPGMGAPPGIHQYNAPPANRPTGLPANFQAPANMPNINFNAPVIRLGTAGQGKPGAPMTQEPERPSHSGSGRQGLGMERGGGEQRGQAKEAPQIIIPPTNEEKLRTIFLHQLPESLGGSAGNVEKLLGAVGNLRRWDPFKSVLDSTKPSTFGFALFEDKESLATAVKLLYEETVEIPTKRQSPADGDTPEDETYEGFDKSKLEVAVDPSTVKYIESFEEEQGGDEEKEKRLEAARNALKQVVKELFYPSAGSNADAEGDVAMKGQENGENVEVVNINIAQEDELADIPAEMREVVAGEIAAFRERSNQRDLERLKKEEEMEEMERQRSGVTRPSRMASPPGGAGPNALPLGPRGVPNAPLGPKGHNAGPNRVAFVNGGISNTEYSINKEDDDPEVDDEEISKRVRAQQSAEKDKSYLESERKWANRERSRQAALEREQSREGQESGSSERRKKDQIERDKAWDDERESSRKAHPIYRDHAAWARKRGLDRADEEAHDEAERRAEQEEKRREKVQSDKARGMADSFLEQQAQEIGQQQQADSVSAPQPFKLSLGAAAQKAQASRGGAARRTIAEVEGLLDDEEAETSTKRQLVPIQYEPTSSTVDMTDEEVSQAVRSLAQEIPSDKDGLWGWKVKWDYLDDGIVRNKLRPFVEKKVVEYLGVQEEMVVSTVEEHLRNHGTAEALAEELEGALDEEAEDLVKKLWRMVIFFTESEKRGLPA